MKYHWWLRYVNRTGKAYGATPSEHRAVHLHSHKIGVRVTPSTTHKGDVIDVSMTEGQYSMNDVPIGQIIDTPDGPRFKPRGGMPADILIANTHYMPSAE